MKQESFVLSEPRLHTLNTSVRAVAAEKTLALIQPYLEQVGVRQIIDITLAGVPACPAYQIVRDDMRSLYFNAGKGYSNVESQVSGLMEAIEVHCFERASASLLVEPGAALRTVACAALSREPIAASSSSALIEGYDHSSHERVLIPAQAVFHELDGVATGATPNGIASGNTRAEAVYHALGEMLERHALASFYMSAEEKATRPAQALERVAAPADAPALQRCLDQLRAQDMHADFLLLSTEAGVAVFICYLDIPLGANTRGAVQGFGAHPDARIAMARALAEAVQILALMPPEYGALADASSEQTRVVMTSKQAAMLEPHMVARQRMLDYKSLQTLRATLELIDFDYMALPPPEPGAGPANIDVALQTLLDNMAAMGWGDVHSCVISPPELPVTVVKVFCPGLECVKGL